MLTAKQERFVQELVKGKSQREAYKAAYDADGMLDKTIDSKAYLEFKKEHIRARYDELLKESIKPDVDDAVEIRRMIVEQEKAIAMANFGDLVTIQLSEDGKKMVAIPKPEGLQNFDMRAVQEMRYDSRGNLILKLYDKQGAINTLRDMYGIGNDEGDRDINIILHATEGYDG